MLNGCIQEGIFVWYIVSDCSLGDPKVKKKRKKENLFLLNNLLFVDKTLYIKSSILHFTFTIIIIFSLSIPQVKGIIYSTL